MVIIKVYHQLINLAFHKVNGTTRIETTATWQVVLFNVFKNFLPYALPIFIGGFVNLVG
jgi:hypothetical protein